MLRNVLFYTKCVTNNVPMLENDIEELDNLGIIEDQDILADNINNNINMDFNLGK